MKARLLFLLLLLPIVTASMDVNITLSKKDIVRQDFFIELYSDSIYDSFEFRMYGEPLSVSYDGEYSVTAGSIIFSKDIVKGTNNISFTIYSDELVQVSGNGRVFRTEYGHLGPINVRVALPEKAILSNEPSAMPPPKSITSDGKHIILEWESENTASLAVFYEKESSPVLFIIASIILVVIATGTIYFFFRSRMKKAVQETLSEDENKIIHQLRKGVTKQKDIAKNLEFSKSKMSKVIRKLEEKGLIEKEPHFKTNKIKLKKIR